MKKTKADPTGQRGNRARTMKKLRARLEEARRKVLTRFRSIPWKRRTVKKIRNQAGDQVVYDYDQTPEQNEQFNREIEAIIALLLLQTNSGDSMPQNWWYKPEVEQPTRQATLEEISEFNRLITLAIAAGITGTGGIQPQRLAPEVVLSSQKYLSELRNVYIDNFQVIKSLNDNTAAQVIREINKGIKAGFTPTDIAKNITARFDVSKGNAERIARTEVNRAYNEAKMRATKTAEQISGLPAFVRHISALLPNRTRPHHAARHMLVYTVEQQNAWWAQDANIINCYCTVETVLQDNDGNYISTGRVSGPSTSLS